MMKKTVCFVLMICCMSLVLTACYDAKEIDEWAYVYTIGVDKGVSDKLRFTFQIPTLKGEASKAEGGETTSQARRNSDFTVISIDCPTFYSGMNMLNTSVPRTLNFMHSKYIVIAEDLAREGVGQFINGMIRSRQIRRIMHVIIVRGQASEFVKELNPVLGTAVSKSQEDMMDARHETALFEDISYNEFISDMKSDYRSPTAILAAINDFSSYKTSGTPPEEFKAAGDYYAGELPRSGGDKTEYLGSALFDGDKMVGELNGEETRVLQMVQGDFNRGFIAIPDPLNKGLRITMDVRQRKRPDIKIVFQAGNPVIHVKLFLEGNILNLQSNVEYESGELNPVLENQVKVFVKNTLDKTIDKCQSLHCDAFGFGEKAAMQFLTIQEWEEYNWLAHFKDAEITTEVEFEIRRTGTMLKTNPTQTSKEKK